MSNLMRSVLALAVTLFATSSFAAESVAESAEESATQHKCLKAMHDNKSLGSILRPSCVGQACYMTNPSSNNVFFEVLENGRSFTIDATRYPTKSHKSFIYKKFNFRSHDGNSIREATIYRGTSGILTSAFQEIVGSSPTESPLSIPDTKDLRPANSKDLIALNEQIRKVLDLHLNPRNLNFQAPRPAYWTQFLEGLRQEICICKEIPGLLSHVIDLRSTLLSSPEAQMTDSDEQQLNCEFIGA